MESSKKKYKPQLKAGIWPVIDSPEAARWAVKQGLSAAGFCAFATAGIAVWSHYSAEMAELSGLNILALLDAFIFAAIAVGLYFNSRVAAILGLLFYILQRVMAIANTPPSAIVMIVFIAAFFISGVRGSFALHKLRRNEPIPPDAPIVP